MKPIKSLMQPLKLKYYFEEWEQRTAIFFVSDAKRQRMEWDKYALGRVCKP
ncbi:hypothetical protein J6TS7_65150 [Paenibacillus dendritiformis]|nr:hypothetical protein J6TS7_65150 [Paenibacillus dendritiformis]